MGFLLSPFLGVAANAGILYALTLLVEGISYTGGLLFFLIGGVILGIFNFIARPLIKVIALPFVLLSGGLFLVVINIFALWFLQYFLSVAAYQGVSLAFSNLSTYVIGAIVFGAINWAVHLVIK